MLGLPLLVDQFDNMLRITERGAGLTLDITKINAYDLYDALNRSVYLSMKFDLDL